MRETNNNSISCTKIAVLAEKMFAILFLVSFLCLLACVATNNHIAVSICGSALLAAICIVGVFCVKKIIITDKQFIMILIVGIIIYFVGCFYITNLMKIALPSDTDIIYESVADLLDDGVLNNVNSKFTYYYPDLGITTNADYFCRYYNNIFILLVFSGLYLIGGIFGIKAATDAGMTLAIGFTTLCVALSILLICLIVKRLFKSNMLSLFVGLISMGCTAFLYSIPNFYTDILIIPFTLLAIYFFILLVQRPGARLSALTGLFFALASMMKITALAAAVAAIIFLVVTHKNKKSLSCILIIVLSLTATMAAFKLFYTNSKIFDFSQKEQLSVPAQTWLAFGSQGDGSYSYDIMSEITSHDTAKERALAASQIITRNYKSYSPLSFIKFKLNKLTYTWNDGHFDASEYAKWPLKPNWTAYLTQSDSPGYIFLYWYSQCYIIMLYVATAIVAFLHLFYKKACVPWYFNLCIFGIIFYLSFFETSPRRAMLAVPFLIVNLSYIIYLFSKDTISLAKRI